MTPEEISKLTTESSNYEQWSNYLGLLNIFLVVFAALVTMATFYVGNKLSNLKEQIANVKISEANARANEATATAEFARVESASATTSAEEAKNKQVELQIELSKAVTAQKIAQKENAEAQLALNKKIEEDRKKMAPRQLSDVQRQKILLLLKNKIKPKVVTNVVIQWGDKEAEEYGLQIKKTLKEAGWRVSDNTQIGPVPYLGVSIIIKNKQSLNDPVFEELVYTLQNTMQQAGINAPLYFNERLVLGEIDLNIGFK